MQLKFDKEQLNSILNDFHNITGLNIQIRDTNWNTLGQNEGNYPQFCNIIQSTNLGFERCHCSDEAIFKKCAETKSMQIHTCHAGLTDIAAPIIFNNSIIAFIILGQIKNDINYQKVLEKVKDLNCDKVLLKESYDSLTVFDMKRINSITNIVIMLAEHILLNNMLRPMSDIHIQKSIEYINNNLCSPIKISDLCKEVGISKSVLYKSFQKHLKVSPNQYVNEQKILKAKELINTTQMSIKEIAYYLGFTNTNYFYKLFKNISGKTPLQYKNSIK